MREDLDLFLENLFVNITALLPSLILAFTILLIGYLLGRGVQKLVQRFILYLNQSFNQRLQTSQLNVDLKISAIFISKTFFWIIIILSILMCVHVLNLHFLSGWFEKIIGYLPNVLAAVIIVFVGIISGRLLGDLIYSAVSKTGVASGKYLGRIVRYLVQFVAVVISVDQLGVDIGFLTDLLNIIVASLLFGASLAFGLGAKTSVSNILGSYYMRKTHQIGTKIRIGAHKGIIVKISDHAISLETESGVMVIPAKDFNELSVNIIKD